MTIFSRYRLLALMKPLAPSIEPSHTIRVRPFDTTYPEEICNIADISEGGIYFRTSLGHYYQGMNVSLTRDFQLRQVAKIDRVERLRHGRSGIAIRILGSSRNNRSLGDSFSASATS